MTTASAEKVEKVSRWGWAATGIIVTAVLFLFPLTIRFPLLDPDEGLHATIAQEMVECGDWFTPRLFGQSFLDKPILYFWAQVVSLRLLGFNEVAVRLPGLLFGLLGAVTTGLLAWRMFGELTGWIAGLLYATTILPTALAQAAAHDVTLPIWINLTLVCLWEAWRPSVTSRTATGCLLLAGVCLGLSILSKGLTGAVAVALAIAGYLVGTKGEVWKVVRYGFFVGLIAILIASPWYLLMESRQPGFLHYYFIERHVLGFFTSEQPHSNQPWWYYLPILLGGGLPWIAYLPVLVVDSLKRKDALLPPPPLFAAIRPTVRMALLWCWLVGWILFVSAARSKLVTYLWPTFSPLAILAAVSWTRLLENNLTPSAQRTFASTFWMSSLGAPILLPSVVLVLQAILPVRYSAGAWIIVLVVAMLSPLPIFEWLANRYATALRVATFALALQFAAAMVCLLPPAAECFSARSLAEHFNRRGALPERLFVVEERVGSIIFYLTPSLRSQICPDRIQALYLGQPWQLQAGDVLAVREGKLSEVEERLRSAGYFQEKVGRYRLYHIGGGP